MSTLRSEYAAHDALLDSVGVTADFNRRAAAIKPAPIRVRRAAPERRVAPMMLCTMLAAVIAAAVLI